MVTLGSQPYPGKTNQEVFDLIVSGHGQLMDVKSLPHCPAVLYVRYWLIIVSQLVNTDRFVCVIVAV